jgi:hypothetical protein
MACTANPSAWRSAWRSVAIVASLLVVAACTDTPLAPGAAERAVPGLPGVFFSTVSGWPETVDIDARLVGTESGGPSTYAVSSNVLLAGVQYTVVIDGNWSAWPHSWWINCTGKFPVKYPSPDVPDGAHAGFDAEGRYANPGSPPSTPCGEQLNRNNGELQFSLDGQNTFFNPTPVTGDDTFDPTHVYEYVVTGAGHPIVFFIPDTRGDNHGVMKATITPLHTAFVSGNHVMTWNAIPPVPEYPGDGQPQACVAHPAVGLDADWTNPHAAFVVNGAAFQTHMQNPSNPQHFTADWINAWPSYEAHTLNSQYPQYGATSPNRHQSWTRYQTTVSGHGDFVLYLAADNCSWIYLSDEHGNNPTLVGSQLEDVRNNPPPTVMYGVTLSGTHTLDFIIYDGGGQAGGMFRLETTSNPPPPLVPPPVDQTPPVITPVVTGTQGAGGWYTSDVSVAWTVVDDESAVTSETGCDAVVVTEDTEGTTFTCTATSAGGTASGSVTVKRDATPPTVSGTVSGTEGSDGWFTSPVTVAWTATAGPSGGVSTADCPAGHADDTAGETLSCTVTNGAGATASASVDFRIDQTPPTVSFAGALSYTVDQQVAISCTAADALSGVASSSCDGVSGPAYAFDVGANTHSSTVADLAGNLHTGSVTFNVEVTFDGLCALVRQLVSHNGTANALCSQLNAAAASAARGNENSKAGQLRAFRDLVRAQTGRHVPADKAPILLRLADYL